MDSNEKIPEIGSNTEISTSDLSPLYPKKNQTGQSGTSLHLIQYDEGEDQILESYEKSSMMGTEEDKDFSDNGSEKTIVSNSGFYKKQYGSKYDQKVYQYDTNQKKKNQLSDLLFLKYGSLIFYLSQLDLTYIATYTVKEKQIQMQNSRDKCFFEFIMEKGKSSFLFSSSQRYDLNYVKRLYNKGKRQVYKWLKCMILGIVQLQEHSIFHFDLCFRNTIKVFNKENQTFCYKLIDFDEALYLAYKTKHKNVREIILLWLINNNPFGKKIYQQCLFPSGLIAKVQSDIKEMGFKVDLKQQYETYNKAVQALWNSQGNKEEKVQKIIEYLKEYSWFYHKVQLFYLISTTLSSQQEDIEKEAKQHILEYVLNIPTANLQENQEALKNLPDFLLQKMFAKQNQPKNYLVLSCEKIECSHLSQQCKRTTCQFVQSEMFLQYRFLSDEKVLKTMLSSLKYWIEASVVPGERTHLSQSIKKNEDYPCSIRDTLFGNIYNILFKQHIHYEHIFKTFSFNQQITPIQSYQIIKEMIHCPEKTLVFMIPFEPQDVIKDNILSSYLYFLLDRIVSIETFSLSYRPTFPFDNKLGKLFFTMTLLDSLLTQEEDPSKKKIILPLNSDPETWFEIFKQCYGQKIKGKGLKKVEQLMIEINKIVFMNDIVLEFQDFIERHHKLKLTSVFEKLRKLKLSKESFQLVQSELNSLREQKVRTNSERLQTMRKRMLDLKHKKVTENLL